MIADVPPQRIRPLNSHPPREPGRFVLYAMQAAQRTEDNPALAVATALANQEGLPLVVAFVLMPHFPEASQRHFTFLLEGLRETFAQLRQLGARPVLRLGPWPEQVAELSREARLVVLDQGYLRLHRRAYRELQGRLDCRLLQVEGEAVVPVELASTKSEHAARTIRPRIHRHLADFLFRCRQAPLQQRGDSLTIDSLDGALDDLPSLLHQLGADPSVGAVSHLFRGGPGQARARLDAFLQRRLASYEQSRSQPQLDGTSSLSPYLHYGMISPVDLALSVREATPNRDGNTDSYLEELIVRRGLSQNFCHFNDDYDRYSCLPPWARKTLEEHRHDPRPDCYERAQLEGGETHDPYWNAAQIEMVETGYMHNTMRMYWGKKILEWSASPEEAYETTLYLNNRYLLDGRDPASFANVGWIFGLHDRAWQERSIYGKIRCMMASGLERKNDPKAYVRKVERLTGRAVPRSPRPGETLSLF